MPDSAASNTSMVIIIKTLFIYPKSIIELCWDDGRGEVVGVHMGELGTHPPKSVNNV